MERLGLIAGNGNFPLIAADAAGKENIKITAVAFKGETSHRLNKLVDKIYWIGIGQMSKLFDILQKEDIHKTIMAGQIKAIHLFKPWIKKDQTMKKFLQRVKDSRGDSLLKSVAEELEKRGVELLNSSFLLKESLADEGVMTDTEPDEKTWQDIKFARPLAKKIADLAIGQTIIVKNTAILAVEAIEGTDETIKRGSRLGKGQIVVVKVSRTSHDMRYDIPVVGLKTLKIAKRYKVKAIAVEAKKTLLIDKNKFLEYANKIGIAVVGI
jgi:hypothetical protein